LINRNSKTPGARRDDVRRVGDDDHAIHRDRRAGVCSFAIFSILTMQTRQDPSMLIPGW
jgi:hypothetical protein